MTGKVTIVREFDCSLGEGPHWDDVSQTLLFVDINKAAVHRWNPANNQMKSIYLPDSTVGAVVPREKGGLVIAAAHRFAFVDEETGATETIKEANLEFPQSRFNDGKCDPAGRFWAGTMGNEKEPGKPRRNEGALYCLQKDKSVTKHVAPVDISNGLSWTADKTVMYYCDSLRFCIDAYDYNIANGEMTNQRVVYKFNREEEGVPDGHCIDADDNIWVAMFFTGQVIKIDPRAGKKLQTIKVSDVAVKTTSVCFGGRNLDEMYVTSARNPSVNKVDGDTSGGLFKITELGAKGLQANIYEG
uniref:Regucalcin n=1 Tax=Phallusia mammillata TaxID=59560 RepID=A0A6F9DRX9_9ASCI|nr:regucalcin-like [Phallusia mammillata]